MNKVQLISLDEVPAGRRIVVRQLCGGRDFISRMTSLGFTADAEVHVIQNYRCGPLIALVRGMRKALGRGEAFKVLVEESRHDQESSQ